MARPLRVLIVEDVEDHALLIVRELQKGGVDPSFQRVETVPELEAALEGEWDAVISDFNLPALNGFEALRVIREKGLDLPFILVSGAIGEEKAAEIMKAGAQAYIAKGNFARLVPTLERELREAEVRRERRRTAESLTRHRLDLEQQVQTLEAELAQVKEELRRERTEKLALEEKLRQARLQEQEQR